jgi:hypothetical protein
MNALSQYNQLNPKTSMDIKSYGEVVIIQPQCASVSTAPSASTPPQQPNDDTHPSKSFFNSYSTQQRIAFMILITVVIMCIVAIVLEEIWRLSPSNTL